MSLHGVALVDKPEGATSFAVVAKLRRLFRAHGVEKAGHTGTLDPLAEGLLPVCIGEATKFAQRLLDARKTYLAQVQFGRATTTLDREGDTTAEGIVEVARGPLEAALKRFRGTIEQTPPAFSALKVDGVPAYRRARRGEIVELEPRRVTIHRLELVALDECAGRALFSVECSKGTYLRVLAADIAHAVGTVGHLSALRRTRTGGYDVASARPLDAWLGASDDEREAWLEPTDSLLSDLPVARFDTVTASALRCGRVVSPPAGTEAGLHRAYGQGFGFIGLVRVEGCKARAERLLSG